MTHSVCRPQQENHAVLARFGSVDSTKFGPAREAAGRGCSLAAPPCRGGARTLCNGHRQNRFWPPPPRPIVQEPPVGKSSDKPLRLLIAPVVGVAEALAQRVKTDLPTHDGLATAAEGVAAAARQAERVPHRMN